MMLIFNERHNDSIPLHHLQLLTIRFMEAVSVRILFAVRLYSAVVIIRLERRLQLIFYKARCFRRKVTSFMSCALGDFTFNWVSISVLLRPAVNVMSHCFCWIKPHYITQELPQHMGRFLSSDESRRRNTDEKRAKQMKMLPEEATQERALDRKRWALRQS